MMSPSGDSILITSAPRSARICVANGPSTTVVRSRILIPASGPGFVSLVSRQARRCGFAVDMLTTGAFLRNRGEKNARDDLPQPALQHLAPDFGSVAREGDRAGHRRIFKDALYRGAAEDASRPTEAAGKKARAEEGSGRRRYRPGGVVGSGADRGDGQEPDHRRAADRGFGKQGRARPPAGGGALGPVAGSVAPGLGSVFRGAKRAALVIFGDRIGGLAGFGREDCRGVGLGIVLRAITKSLGVRVIVPGTLVAGDAVDDFVADVRMLEPDADELGVVPGADPDRQPALVDRLLAEIADTRTQHPDPEFVGIEAGERFAKGLADAVAAVRPWHDPVIDLLRTGIKADSMVAGGEHDALHASAPRRLEHIVETDNVPFEDRRPPFCNRNASGSAGEMC